jgi:hypothetical protein
MRKRKGASIITPYRSLEDSMRDREEFYAIMKELKPVYFPPEKTVSWTVKIWICLKMRREASRILWTRLHGR